MKLLKYAIFLSTLGSIFLVIYRKSDDIGFRRWWTSIRTAVLIAAILAGLIPNCVGAIEPTGNNNQVYHERLVSDQKVILAKTGDSSPSVPISLGRGQPSHFPTPPSHPSRPVRGVNPYRVAPKIVDPGLGAGANPAGAGNGGADWDEHPKKEQPQESKTFDYDYRSNSPKNEKKSQDQCSIDEQNKAGIDELLDSSEFIYNLETKTARKALRKVWKNPEAKKEVLAGLDKMNSGELLPRNQKNFKGFKTLKELKFTKTRMLVQPGINGGPDQIVAIFMRSDMDNIASIFKSKYK